jgi:gliding motility-associated-like protein
MKKSRFILLIFFTLSVDALAFFCELNVVDYDVVKSLPYIDANSAVSVVSNYGSFKSAVGFIRTFSIFGNFSMHTYFRTYYRFVCEELMKNDSCFTTQFAFTPDGDGINDTWLIAELSTRYPNNNVTIFNRWGQVLYNSDGYLTPWDGKFNNKDLPVGSYYYIIDFNDALDTPNATGIVTIIRN